MYTSRCEQKTKLPEFQNVIRITFNLVLIYFQDNTNSMFQLMSFNLFAFIFLLFIKVMVVEVLRGIQF